MVANLIYLTLTYVQLSLRPLLLMTALMTTPAWAIPNLDPAVTTEAPPTDGGNGEKSAPEGQASAELESVSMADQNAARPNLRGHGWRFVFDERLSLSTGIYYGPSESAAQKTLVLFGVDYQLPVNPSEINHLGLAVSSTPNPRLYLARESYLRNYWRFLKSWSYLLQLELDSQQQLGSFLSTRYYMAGVGLNFSWGSGFESTLNVFPFSGREPAAEIKLNYVLDTF
jgi:hypothetical protein